MAKKNEVVDDRPRKTLGPIKNEMVLANAETAPELAAKMPKGRTLMRVKRTFAEEMGMTIIGSLK